MRHCRSASQGYATVPIDVIFQPKVEIAEKVLTPHYEDPATGAHFDFATVVKKLKVLADKQERAKDKEEKLPLIETKTERKLLAVKWDELMKVFGPENCGKYQKFLVANGSYRTQQKQNEGINGYMMTQTVYNNPGSPTMKLHSRKDSNNGASWKSHVRCQTLDLEKHLKQSPRNDCKNNPRNIAAKAGDEYKVIKRQTTTIVISPSCIKLLDRGKNIRGKLSAKDLQQQQQQQQLRTIVHRLPENSPYAIGLKDKRVNKKLL